MKTTFFGLGSFRNSMHMQTQVCNLVEQTGFPAVMGFEFYPVIVVSESAAPDAETLSQNQRLQERGFELVEIPGVAKAQTHAPGQLVIYPVIPIAKLKISEADVLHVLQEATHHWLQKYRIQSQLSEDGLKMTVEKETIADINTEMRGDLCRAMVSISVTKFLSPATGSGLELKAAFDEWNLYFTSSLLKIIPGK